MAENELQILIKGIFSRIKEKYGYTDEQALIYLKGYEDCAEEHQQSLEKRDKMLRDTIAELCETKRLLKVAVEDFTAIAEVHAAATPILCPQYEKYMKAIDIRTRKWHYEDEAMKLIGEDSDIKFEQE